MYEIYGNFDFREWFFVVLEIFDFGKVALYGGPEGQSAKLPLSAKMRNATLGQRPPKVANAYD